jgi:hypothetical protein
LACIVLQGFKLLFLISLGSSFLWASKWIDTNWVSALIALLCGACIPAMWRASTSIPSFTLRGLALRFPVWAALAIIPLLLLIPLGFQAKLLEAFNSWVVLLRTVNSGNFSLSQVWLLIEIGIPLALGGSYLCVVLLAFQVFSKRVVDYFFDKNA